MSSSELPDDVCSAGEQFLEAVTLPYGSLKPGVYLYGSESAFWYRLSNRWRSVRKNVRAWPFKTKQRLRQSRKRYAPDPDPHERLEVRLYEIAARKFGPDQGDDQGNGSQNSLFS